MQLLKYLIIEYLKKFITLFIATFLILVLAEWTGLNKFVDHYIFQLISTMAIFGIYFASLVDGTTSCKSWIKNTPYTRETLARIIYAFNLLKLFTSTYVTILLSLYIWRADIPQLPFKTWELIFHLPKYFYNKTNIFISNVIPNITQSIDSLTLTMLLAALLFFLGLPFYSNISNYSSRVPPNFLRRYFPRMRSFPDTDKLLVVVLVLGVFLFQSIYQIEIIKLLIVFVAVPFLNIRNFASSLNLKKFYYLRRPIIPGALLLTFYLICISYSNYRISQPHLTESEIVTEALTHGPNVQKVSTSSLMAELRKDISSERIGEIAKYMYLKKSPFDPEYETEFGPIPDFKWKLPSIEFKEVINGKTSAHALVVSLGLFNRHELSVEQIEMFYEKYSLLISSNLKEHESYLPAVKNYISWRDFNPTEIDQLLKTRNIELHKIAINSSLAPINNQAKEQRAYRQGRERPRGDVLAFDIQDYLIKNIENFSTPVIIAATDLISRGQCRTISSDDVYQRVMSGERLSHKQLNCKKVEKVSQMVQLKNYYLNGHFIWEQKQTF